MTRLGYCLYASSLDNTWQGLLALQPGALVVIDGYHLLPALGSEPYIVWRPWIPGTMREHTPQQWFNEVYRQWEAKGRRKFHAIQYANESNRIAESGYPEGSREAALATVEWGLEVTDLIRTAWPGVLDVHSPPLSPNVPGWQNFYHWLAPLIDSADVLSCHTYLDQPRSYIDPHLLYANMPLFISECGDRGNGTAEYGRRLLAWYNGLPDYVADACAYVYNSTDGQDTAWELCGTPAEAVLIEAGG